MFEGGIVFFWGGEGGGLRSGNFGVKIKQGSNLLIYASEPH